MSAVEELRGRIRARRRAPEEPWRPPVIGDFLHGLPVLAFDATLSHCGWARLEVSPSGVKIWAKGTVNPQTSQLSYLGTWDKARELHARLGEIDLAFGEEAQLVVEAPSVGGGSRTESSLIAGLMVSMMRPAGICRPVSATHVSAVLLGDPRVHSAERKRRIGRVVTGFVPEAAGRGWNQDQRDAVATGLTYLHDQARRFSLVADTGGGS